MSKDKFDAQFGAHDETPRRAIDDSRPLDDAHDLGEARRLDDGSAIVLHEERAVAETQKVRAQAVRVRVKVVTEEKTITVPLRREVLEIIELDDDPEAATNATGIKKPREIVLHEERVAVETVAYEKVTLRRQKAREDAVITTDVAREVLEIDGDEDLRCR